MAKVKLSITLEDEIVKRADEICKEENRNRSNLIEVALSEYILKSERGSMFGKKRNNDKLKF